MEVKCENVICLCMEEKMATVILFEGRRYLVEKTEGNGCEATALPDKTDDLKQMVVKRKDGEQVLTLGRVIARVGNNLVHENPLNEMRELKQKDKMTPLNMASVLHKYHKGLKASTIVVYRSGYQNFINKAKDVDIRMNDKNVIYENVTEKNKEKIKKIIMVLDDNATFDEILKEADMTDYKLKLILNDPSMSIKKQYNDLGKEKYCLTT